MKFGISILEEISSLIFFYFIYFLYIPTSVYELNEGINLLRIVDFFGRNTKQVISIPLFYFYDNGTVEKRIFIQ